MNGKARVVVVLAAVLVACGVVHGMGLNKDPRKKAPPRNPEPRRSRDAESPVP